MPPKAQKAPQGPTSPATPPDLGASDPTATVQGLTTPVGTGTPGDKTAEGPEPTVTGLSVRTKDGEKFRRAGIDFGPVPTVLQIKDLTSDQVEALMGEQMLRVEVIAKPGEE